MNLKSERGSVTIYVLSVTICITLILLSIFVGMMNKNSSQYKQIEQIYNEYAGESNNEKIDNVYEDTINATNGRVQISAYFYKQSGEKYDLSEYTNESLTLKVSCSGGNNGEKAKITIGNKVVEYTSQGITIDENCVIKIVYSGKQKTITVNGIDKTAPTVAMNPNGGTGYVMPTTGKATIKTTLTASDVGESGIKTKQYAWSTSKDTEPTEGWTDFENGKEISKTDCTQGDYYLWTKVLDGAGNRAEKVKVSNVFTVTGQTIDESKITIALSTEDWTNKDVTAVITYGKNLTQNRKAGFGTANIANAMTVTATENGTIYAEATDRAGNKVVVTKQVTKIDKKAPTIPTITAKLDSDAGNAYDGTWTNKPVVISAQAIDEASQINRIEYSYDNATWKTDWGNSLVTNGNTSSIKGTWNSNYDKTVYVRAVDNAGNASGSSSMILKQDTAKPEISTITNSSNGNWTNSDVVVTLNGTDNLSGIKEFQWFENNAWTTRDLSTKAGVGTITYTADRDLNIRFRVIDNAGNISEEKTSQVRIDKVKPSAPVITNTSDGKWTNKDVTITLKSTDANSGIAKYQLKYSGTNGAWKDVSNPDPWGAERNETVYYRAVDNAGNVSAESSTVIKIDKTAPVKPTYVSRYQDKTAYTSGTWTNKTVYTDITTEDKASGVAKIQYSFDNSTWGDLKLLASSGIQVNGTKATGTEEWTLKDRNNNVWFRAVDNVGNVSEASDVFNVRYDLSGPTSLVVTAKLNSDTGDIYDGNWTNKPVVISAQATDEASQINRIEYSYDNATWKTDWGTNLVTNGNTSSIKGTWNSNYNTTVYVRAVDNMGNASESKSVVLKQDTTAPAAPTLTNSSNGNWTKNSVKVTLASTDAGSGVAKYQVKYSGTNGAWNDVSNPDPWSAERNETVYYRAVDNAGNVSAESSTAIKIDKTAPVKPTYVSRYADKTAYTSGTWTNKTAYTDITTEDKASGVAKIQYSFDNSTWGDLSLLASRGIQVSGTKATGTEEWTLKDRNNNVWFRAVDNVGNVSEASDVFNVKYDLTAPTASKTEVKNLTATGYDVYVYNVADAGSGVNRVQFPTWTESKGQDDIISDWVTNSKSTGTKQSDGTTWVYHVNTTDHKNEYGKYNTHVYVYDNLGNSNSIGGVSPTVPSVKITYDNNYLDGNLWKDSDNLDNWYYAGTTVKSKANTKDESVTNGYITELTMAAGTSGGPYKSGHTKLTAGKTYTWSVYVKASNNKTLAIGDEQNGQKNVNVTTEWQKITHTFTATEADYYAFVLYGGWSDGEKLYVHSLEIKEGNGIDSTSAEQGYGLQLGTLPTVTRTGYDFQGWYTAPTGGTKISAQTTAPSGNVTYYAHWKIKSYKVTFSGATTATKMYNERLGTLPTVTKTGYTLAGWYTASSGGTKISTNTRIGAGDVTYYPQWTINKYSIDLNYTVDGTIYNSGYNSRIQTKLKIGGVDLGYQTDYCQKKDYGTAWEITGLKIDGVEVAYTAKGTLGADTLDLRIYFYTIALGVNNAEYGSISPTELIVPNNNTTYTTNGAKLTLSDGRSATATVKNITGYTTTFASWSSASGTITTKTTITANFNRTINNYYVDLNMNVDGTGYASGYNERIYAKLKVGGVDKGYVKDYYTQHPYGTTWEVTGLKIDGTEIAYSASGTLGAGNLDLRLYFYTITLGVNNGNYGSISPTSLIVPNNSTTYTTSGATLTLKDGRTATATVKNQAGYTTTFASWSSASGTITTKTTITANFNRVDNIAPEINAYAGAMLYTDPTFASGTNSTHTYNNKGNGKVTITRKAISDSPTGSGQGLEIKTTGEASPGHGGFYFGTGTSANKEYITRIVAKIPTGYTINWASNAYGSTGNSAKWLTSQAGTGDWQEYIIRVQCGSTGSFSSTNFYYINGGSTATDSAPVTWQLAYATVIDTSKWANKNYIISSATDAGTGITAYGINQSSTTQPTWTTFSANSNVCKMSSEYTKNGTYYVWYKDASGNINKKAVMISKTDNTAPTASRTEVKNLTATGYDVYIYNVADSGSGVNRVQFPTWTESNGQDDIISDWVTNSKSTGTKQSDGTTWVYHVNTTDHKNEYGKYNTHIYAYDNLGNSNCIGGVSPTVPGVTVTYNYSENGGTSATKTSATVGYNSAVDLTPRATKNGYTFVGWNTNKDATTALSSLKVSASGATLYAIFKKDITATYKYWNGSAATSTTKSATVYNKTTSATITAPTLANSSKDGITYTARGWSTSNTGNATIAVTSGGSQTISANTTYYGAYQATITATFYYHKGTDQYATTQTSATASGTRYMNSSGAYINSNIKIPTEVIKSTGYYGTQYKGVASAVSSSTAVTPNTGTTKYYAFYNVGITYYYYNGSAHTSSTGTRIATTNGSAYSNKVDNEPKPSNYDGAAFSHWSYDATKYSADYKRTPTTTAMLALYAVYPKTVTATFYYHGGTDQYTATQTRTTATGTRYYISKSGGVNTYNNNISIPSAVTSSTGYYGTTYKGVAAAKSSSTSATPTTATTAYYAFYNVGITYYYYNGLAQTTATSTRRATSNGTTYVATVDSEPSKPNYYGATFSHWSYDATKYSADYKRTPAATTVLELYAVYSKTVTAIFNYYNGSAAATTTASGTKYYISKSGGVNTYNNNISVPSAVSSSKGPSGIAYSHISTIRTGSATTPNTSTGIYYAVYKKTVTATKKEYNNKTSSLTGTAYGYYNGKVTNARINLGTSTASGYTFRGWSTSAAADATTVNATVSLVNNTTYYASYSSTSTISLTYNANSGSGAPGSQTGTITRYMNYVGTTKDSGSVTLTVSATKPTRTGYAFVSWNTKSDGTGTSYASGATLKTSANATLYAIWKKEVKVGDIISLISTKGTTERFYVLSYDESTQKAKALAEWNLKVGTNYDSSGIKIADIPTTESGYGLQDSTMKGWLSGQQRNGTLAFSSSRYWNDTYTPQGSSSYPWVYNNKSNLYQYVEAYKTKLGNTDKVSEVSLASYEDINALWSNKSNYKWLYSTSFWLGSASGASNSSVWRVKTDGSFSFYAYNFGSNWRGSPSYNYRYVENLKRL